MVAPPSHVFIPASEGQSRSPCPALNALANHGYMGLTFKELVYALRDVYNLSIPFAMMLSAAGIILCSHHMKLDLKDLAKHNIIEHDGSMVHDDVLPGQHIASTIPSQDLVQDLVHRVGHGRGLSLADFARVRADRGSKLPAPLHWIHSKIATAEAALAWLVMKDGYNVVPLKSIREWYGEERIPQGWTRPVKPIGVLLVRGTASKLANQMRH